ncbi:MAG: hypothetical protein ACYDER_05855 [Ktedonobacteraceae bacterium]
MAKHASLIVRLRLEGSAQLVPAIDEVDGVIGLLPGSVFTAMADGTWTRLKACRNAHDSSGAVNIGDSLK